MLQLVCALALGLACAVPAMAQQAPVTRPVIEVVVVGGEGASPSVEAALTGGALAEFEIRWRRSHRIDPLELVDPGATDVAVRCWIDLDDPRSARIYLTNAAAERFVVRIVPLSGRLDESDREVLSQVIELSVQALETELAAGVPRDEAFPSKPPPPEPAPAPPAPAPPRLALRPGSFYSLAAHSDAVALTHGPGLLVSLVWSRAGVALATGVRGRYELPATARDDRIGLRFATLALRAEVEGLITGSVGHLGLRLGLGPDLVWLWPRSSRADEGWEPERDRLSRALVCSAGVSAGWYVSERVSLFVDIGVEVDPARVHYDIDLGSERQPVVTRYRARPTGTFGVRLW